MTGINNEVILYGLDKYSQTIDRIISELDIGDNPDICFDIKLMLVEALNNAYLHGNGSDAGKAIKLRYSYYGENIRFEVEDTGKGFENVVIPEGLPDSNLLNNCGRGLFLISCISDRMEMKGNVIIIEKQIPEINLTL